MTMIPGRLNSVGYVDILDEVLVPSIEAYGNLQDVVFMQVKIYSVNTPTITHFSKNNVSRTIILYILHYGLANGLKGIQILN